jgi:hypothetical protein
MTDKTRGILLALMVVTVSAAAGCGGSSSNNLEQFTGTWKYTQSLGTLSCTGQADQQGLLGSSKLWAQGVSSDLVDLSPSIFDPTTQCFYAFDVKGKVATIQPGQTCNFSDGAGGLIDETPTTWTFTLTSATTADEVLTESLASASCTLTGMATLEKVAESK